MITAGIDAGSRTVKVALYDTDRAAVVASACIDQGVEQEALARELLEGVLTRQGLDTGAVACTVATGYGRNLIGFADTTVTEITCHARGVTHLVTDARTIIEIGGQDSKLIRLDGKGVVHDFAMNDRCAAGTGRFLELVADRIGVPLTELGRLAGKSRRPAVISSMCVVFAETEIIGLLASGAPPEDIVAGVQDAIAARVCAMAGRSLHEPVWFTGGVAMVPGMGDRLALVLGHAVKVAPQPQYTGAIGAALIAAATSN